jgi:vitamin B12 transporter
MISKHWAFLLLSVTGSASAFAQSTKDSTGKQLDQVIVTATKYPVKQSQTGKVVIVITHEEIEKSVGKPLGELLGEQAGIIVSGSLNAPGTNQSIFIRGAGSGRALVLIDGIPVSDPTATDNSFDINLIPVTMIERIEISKGAQSTLYGSDAIAGVINIITIKSDVKAPFNVKASGSGGNYGTYNANAQVFGKVADQLTYNVRYNHDHSSGFPTATDTFKTASSPVPFLNDGFKSDLVAGNLGWNATSALAIKGFFQYSQYKADIDAGPFTPAVDYTSTTKSLLAGGGFTYKLANTTITGNYRYSTSDLHLLEDSVYGQSYYTDHYVGTSQYVEMFASTNLGYGFTLLNGADYRYAAMHEASNLRRLQGHLRQPDFHVQFAVVQRQVRTERRARRQAEYGLPIWQQLYLYFQSCLADRPQLEDIWQHRHCFQGPYPVSAVFSLWRSLPPARDIEEL